MKKLNESTAIELGAELLGETIIFSVAVLTLALEYYRQSKKASAEAAQLEERWSQVENRIEELEFLTEKQRTEIRELTRLMYANQSKQKVPPQPSTPPSSGSSPVKPTPKGSGTAGSDSSKPSGSSTGKHLLSRPIEEALHKVNLA